MPKINMTTGFNVTMPNGEVVSIPAGESEQSAEVAEHWFVRAHAVGVPKGRMPVVQGPGGIMIEADEAGQRVGPQSLSPDPLAPPVRQEGPIAWSVENPRALEQAAEAADEAGAAKTEPVDGRQAVARQPTAKQAADAKSK